MVSDPTTAVADRPSVPPTPRYHARLRDHLRALEPELWHWFGQVRADERVDDAAEVELLKTTYRLDGGVHDALTGHATLIAGQLGLGEPVVLYQQLHDEDRNARVFRLNGRIHVVFVGDILDLFDTDEQQAVLAHELAHIALWELDEGDFATLDHLVHRLALEAPTNDALVESARRIRLRTEVWADAVAVAVLGDQRPVISTIVKTVTGLRNVDPDAYLRQARQILERDPGASRQLTHPELHIRVACLAAAELDHREDLIDELIGGPDDLDRIDLLGQGRLLDLVRRTMASAHPLLPTDDAIDAHVRHVVAVHELGSLTPLRDDELADASPSVRHLVAAQLVDLGFVPREGDGLAELRTLSTEADRVGVAAEFDKLVAKTGERTIAQARRLRTDTGTDGR